MGPYLWKGRLPSSHFLSLQDEVTNADPGSSVSLRQVDSQNSVPPPAVTKCRGKEREETKWPESVFLKSQVTDDKSSHLSPQNACLNTQVNK